MIRLANAVVCLGGAFILHEIPNLDIPVHAQTKSISQNDIDQYGLRARVDIQQNLLDRLEAKTEAKTDQIDHHLESTDSHLSELDNKVSEFQGIGTGILGLLGVLNILGFINTVKPRMRDES